MEESMFREIEIEVANENFRIARNKIEHLLGIKLQLSELLELREDIKFVHDIYFKDHKRLEEKGLFGGDKHTIAPDDEAAILFMNRNYGTRFNNLERKSVENFFNERIGAFDLTGLDYYSEYFKRVQERMYIP